MTSFTLNRLFSLLLDGLFAAVPDAQPGPKNEGPYTKSKKEAAEVKLERLKTVSMLALHITHDDGRFAHYEKLLETLQITDLFPSIDTLIVSPLGALRSGGDSLRPGFLRSAKPRDICIFSSHLGYHDRLRIDNWITSWRKGMARLRNIEYPRTGGENRKYSKGEAATRPFRHRYHLPPYDVSAH